MAIEVSLYLDCGGCGHKLTGTGGDGGITVDPCDWCIDAAHSAGRDEGREEASTE